jgi:hypothetical protein
MAYCGNCGKQLSDGAAFCNSCGTKTGQTRPENASVKQEARLVLAGSKKEGFLKRSSCYVVFYDNDLVLAHVGKDRQNDEMNRYRNELKEQGKGFFRSAAAMIGFWNHYGDRYYTMSKQQMINEDAKNRTIAYVDISKLIFKTVNRSTVENSGSSATGMMTIKTASGKVQLTHNYHDSNKKIKGILTDLFGKKLRYSGGILTINIGINKDVIS